MGDPRVSRHVPLTDLEIEEVRDILMEHLKIEIARQSMSSLHLNKHLLVIATVVQKLHRVQRGERR